MANTSVKSLARIRRHRHIRQRVLGTEERPRLCVFRSSKHIYAQVIDDTTGRTLVSASSIGTKEGGNCGGATGVGKALGERAVSAGISKVVFDRNGFKYHGRVAALADAAREAGLEF